MLPSAIFFPQSHEIGPGPEFERVGFNLLGRSPLVAHYLRTRELMGKEQEPVQFVGRTEVVKLQYPLIYSVEGLMIYCPGQSVKRSGHRYSDQFYFRQGILLFQRLSTQMLFL